MSRRTRQLPIAFCEKLTIVRSASSHKPTPTAKRKVVCHHLKRKTKTWKRKERNLLRNTRFPDSESTCDVCVDILEHERWRSVDIRSDSYSTQKRQVGEISWKYLSVYEQKKQSGHESVSKNSRHLFTLLSRAVVLGTRVWEGHWFDFRIVIVVILNGIPRHSVVDVVKELDFCALQKH